MPAEPDQIIGLGSQLTILAYLIVLIGIGIAGKITSKEKSLKDFYLGGKGFGFFILLLTLYATQYSGNTLIGFAGRGYRTGFGIFMSIPLMMGIIGVYVIYAPKLRSLSRKRGYITFADYIQDRFTSRTLTTLISLSGIIALSNYLVTNLKAMGEMTVILSDGRFTAMEGIITLAGIIIIYESLGGLRSVAWSDALQGIILFIGCIVIFFAIIQSFGGVAGALEKLQQAKPDFWQAPSFADCIQWGSTVVIISFGLAMYPHAIQRIYAAKSAITLKRSLQIMVFLPLFTTLLMVSIGILGNIDHADLSRAESEGITLLMLIDFARANPSADWVMAIFVTAVFAAIMSTADSAVLSISSSITQDFLRPFANIQDQQKLVRIGKIASWGIMAITVILAINLPQTMWKFFEIKSELLAQTAPALLFGLHRKDITTKAVLYGFCAGTAFTLFFALGSITTTFIPAKIGMLHAGLIGLAINVFVIMILKTPKSIGNKN